MADWWLIVHTPTGPHVLQLGELDDAAKDTAIARAKVLTGFPPEDLPADARWNIALTVGVPHPTLLTIARSQTVAELARVPDADVQTYRQQCADGRLNGALQTARIAVAALTPDQRAVIRDELSSTTTISPKPIGGR